MRADSNDGVAGRVASFQACVDLRMQSRPRPADKAQAHGRGLCGTLLGVGGQVEKDTSVATAQSGAEQALRFGAGIGDAPSCFLQQEDASAYGAEDGVQQRIGSALHAGHRVSGQGVLDLPCRLEGEEQGRHVVESGTARNVEATEALASGGEHRHGHAAPALLAEAEVLFAEDLRRSPAVESETDGVGADALLRPVGAGAEADAVGAA